jgi:hypothetical protein
MLSSCQVSRSATNQRLMSHLGHKPERGEANGESTHKPERGATAVVPNSGSFRLNGFVDPCCSPAGARQRGPSAIVPDGARCTACPSRHQPYQGRLDALRSRARGNAVTKARRRNVETTPSTHFPVRCPAHAARRADLRRFRRFVNQDRALSVPTACMIERALNRSTALATVPTDQIDFGQKPG